MLILKKSGKNVAFVVMPLWLEIKGNKVSSLRYHTLMKTMASKENFTHAGLSLLLSYHVHPAPCVLSIVFMIAPV